MGYYSLPNYGINRRTKNNLLDESLQDASVEMSEEGQIENESQIKGPKFVHKKLEQIQLQINEDIPDFEDERLEEHEAKPLTTKRELRNLVVVFKDDSHDFVLAVVPEESQEGMPQLQNDYQTVIENITDIFDKLPKPGDGPQDLLSNQILYRKSIHYYN